LSAREGENVSQEINQPPEPVVDKVKRTRKPNAVHDKLEKLFTQKGGCTMHDIWNAGFEYPAMAALKIFERRGYKVSVKEVPGPLKNRRRQPGMSGPKSANSPGPWSVRDEDGLPRNIPPCTQIAELQFTPFSGGLDIWWSWDLVVLGSGGLGTGPHR